MGCCGYSDVMIWLRDSLSTSPDKSHFIGTINTSGRPAHVPENILIVKAQIRKIWYPPAPFAYPQTLYPPSARAFCISVKEQRHHPEGGRDDRYLKRRCREQTRRGQLRIGSVTISVVLHVIFTLCQTLACVTWKRNKPSLRGIKVLKQVKSASFL